MGPLSDTGVPPAKVTSTIRDIAFWLDVPSLDKLLTTRSASKFAKVLIDSEIASEKLAESMKTKNHKAEFHWEDQWLAQRVRANPVSQIVSRSTLYASKNEWMVLSRVSSGKLERILVQTGEKNEMRGVKLKKDLAHSRINLLSLIGTLKASGYSDCDANPKATEPALRALIKGDNLLGCLDSTHFSVQDVLKDDGTALENHLNAYKHVAEAPQTPPTEDTDIMKWSYERLWLLAYQPHTQAIFVQSASNYSELQKILTNKKTQKAVGFTLPKMSKKPNSEFEAFFARWKLLTPQRWYGDQVFAKDIITVAENLREEANEDADWFSLVKLKSKKMQTVLPQRAALRLQLWKFCVKNSVESDDADKNKAVKAEIDKATSVFDLEVGSEAAEHALQLHAEVHCNETKMRAVVSFYHRCLASNQDESGCATAEEMFLFSEDTIMGVMGVLDESTDHETPEGLIPELKSSAMELVAFNKGLLAWCFRYMAGWTVPNEMEGWTCEDFHRVCKFDDDIIAISGQEDRSNRAKKKHTRHIPVVVVTESGGQGRALSRVKTGGDTTSKRDRTANDPLKITEVDMATMSHWISTANQIKDVPSQDTYGGLCLAMKKVSASLSDISTVLGTCQPNVDYNMWMVWYGMQMSNCETMWKLINEINYEYEPTSCLEFGIDEARYNDLPITIKMVNTQENADTNVWWPMGDSSPTPALHADVILSKSVAVRLRVDGLVHVQKGMSSNAIDSSKLPDTIIKTNNGVVIFDMRHVDSVVRVDGTVVAGTLPTPRALLEQFLCKTRYHAQSDEPPNYPVLEVYQAPSKMPYLKTTCETLPPNFNTWILTVDTRKYYVERISLDDRKKCMEACIQIYREVTTEEDVIQKLETEITAASNEVGNLERGVDEMEDTLSEEDRKTSRQLAAMFASLEAKRASLEEKQNARNHLTAMLKKTSLRVRRKLGLLRAHGVSVCGHDSCESNCARQHRLPLQGLLGDVVCRALRPLRTHCVPFCGHDGCQTHHEPLLPHAAVTPPLHVAGATARPAAFVRGKAVSHHPK